MRPDVTDQDPMSLVTAMARREAGASLLPPPPEEAGADGGSCLVRVRLLDCPTCGARQHERAWPLPFSSTADTGPLVSMLACEMLTARAVLPIVFASKNVPGLRDAEFETRGVTWLELAHLRLDKALTALDAAESWVDDPTGTPGRTIPASVRAYHPGGRTWSEHRRTIVPSFLSAHPAVPEALERHYAKQRRDAVLVGYGRVRENA